MTSSVQRSRLFPSEFKSANDWGASAPLRRMKGEKMSIIVVEGIDRVGKSTLANAICDWHEYDSHGRFHVFKHDNGMFDYKDMDNNNETDKMFQLIEMVKLFSGNVIFDRFHLSEFVYGLCEREYKFSTAYNNMLLIDDMLEKLGAVLVYVKPTSLLWSSQKHGKSLDKHNMLMEAAFNDSSMKKVVTDFKSISDDNRREDLIYQIRDRLTDV